VNMAKKRTNVIPIIEDARHPQKYRMLVGMCDVMFADVAQPDQARIFALNAQYFLKVGGFDSSASSHTLARADRTEDTIRQPLSRGLASDCATALLCGKRRLLVADELWLVPLTCWSREGCKSTLVYPHMYFLSLPTPAPPNERWRVLFPLTSYWSRHGQHKFSCLSAHVFPISPHPPPLHL
jgi:hypothetical protein